MVAGKQSPEKRKRLGSSGLSGLPKSFSFEGVSARRLASPSFDFGLRVPSVLGCVRSGSIAPSEEGLIGTGWRAKRGSQVKVFCSSVIFATLTTFPSEITSSVTSRCAMRSRLDSRSLFASGGRGTEFRLICLICAEGKRRGLPVTVIATPDSLFWE